MQIYIESLYADLSDKKLCELIRGINYIYMHDSDSNTLISEVISRCDKSNMLALLERDDLDVNDLVPGIVKLYDVEIMLTLLNRQELDFNNLLCEVAANGSVDMMQQLIASRNPDIDINYIPSMLLAMQCGQAKIFKELFRDGITEDTSIDEIAQFSQKMLAINTQQKANAISEGNDHFLKANTQIENFLISHGALDFMGNDIDLSNDHF